LPEGRVIQGVGGFYEIMDFESGQTVTALARGKFKRDDRIIVGDMVNYEITTEGQGVIEELYPRKVKLVRPMVSNVDRIAIVFALQNPDYNRLLVDRFLVLAETTGLKKLLVFNKQDLVGRASERAAVEPYESLGYSVVVTSTKTRKGKRLFLNEIQDGVTVLAGPSGVGKSALMNLVCPEFARETGEVSKKIGRGRHTTRQAKLLPILNKPGFIVDTPGFTQLDFDFIAPDQVADFFPDFLPWIKECRFQGCLHKKEPDCSIKEAVQTGEIFSWRYEHYLTFLEEVERFNSTTQKYRGRRRR